jgi:hypothetical protein
MRAATWRTLNRASVPASASRRRRMKGPNACGTVCSIYYTPCRVKWNLRR